MPLKPYHEHPLLQDYSEWRGSRQPYQYRAEWYCPDCNLSVQGPPWEVGEYVVTNVYRYRVGRSWRVYTRATWENHYPRDYYFVFESTRKRDAIKHARALERGHKQLVRALDKGDAKALAEIHRDVKRVEREEREEEEETHG